MRRKISLFVRYLTKDDVNRSRFITIDICEFPKELREKYIENRDLGYLIELYVYNRWNESGITILNVSVLNAFDDFIMNSI